jgi:hypothetical protein
MACDGMRSGRGEEGTAGSSESARQWETVVMKRRVDVADRVRCIDKQDKIGRMRHECNIDDRLVDD